MQPLIISNNDDNSMVNYYSSKYVSLSELVILHYNTIRLIKNEFQF